MLFVYTSHIAEIALSPPAEARMPGLAPRNERMLTSLLLFFMDIAMFIAVLPSGPMLFVSAPRSTAGHKRSALLAWTAAQRSDNASSCVLLVGELGSLDDSEMRLSQTSRFLL